MKLTTLIMTCVFFSLPVMADAAKQADAPRIQYALEAFGSPLAQVLDAVTHNTGKKSLVDLSVQSQISLYGVEVGKMTYPDLLAILNSNELAAVKIDNYVRIVKKGMRAPCRSRLLLMPTTLLTPMKLY